MKTAGAQNFNFVLSVQKLICRVVVAFLSVLCAWLESFKLFDELSFIVICSLLRFSFSIAAAHCQAAEFHKNLALSCIYQSIRDSLVRVWVAKLKKILRVI